MGLACIGEVLGGVGWSVKRVRRGVLIWCFLAYYYQHRKAIQCQKMVINISCI